MASTGKSPGMLMRNAGIFNPVLVQAVGLCPVVAMATSIKSAALLALISAVIITLSEFIASLFLKILPRWVRIGIYIILGAAIVSPLMIFIERINAPLFSSLGIYLPIMAVNSLNVLRCERFAVKISPFKALLDGLTASVGYAAVLLVSGFVRELLGSGSIFGFKFFKGHTLTGLLLPFGGFLILGFSGAVLRALISKFWPKYLDKKQPKPGAKKKPAIQAEKNAPKKPNTVSVPEFAADESTFTLEELEIDPDSSSSAQPSDASPLNTETDSVPTVKENGVAETKLPAEGASQPTDTDAEASVSAEGAEDAAFADLTIDDIESDSDNQASTYSDSEDDLEALMSRSIGDILTKPKKEEEDE